MLLSPFFLCTLCFTTGIITAHTEYTVSIQAIIFTISFCLFYYSTYSTKKKRPHPALLCILLNIFLILGYVHYQCYSYQWKILVKKATEKREIFYGIIVDQKKTESNSLRLTIQCYSPEYLTNKSLFIYIKNSNPKILYNTGQHIKIRGKLSEAKKADFNAFLIKEQIIGTIFTKDTYIQIIDQKSIKRYMLELKNNIRTTATQHMSPETKQLFELLFLGYKEESKITSIDLRFKEWGISHFLARSGLHLNFLIALVSSFLMYIPITWSFKQVIILLIVFCYCTLTWATIPITRTFLMFFFIKLFLIIKYQYDPFNIICFVWMLFLINNPFYLFFLDFQLTFILSGALTWLSKQEKNKLKHS